jgi:hypothetical protein
VASAIVTDSVDSDANSHNDPDVSGINGTARRKRLLSNKKNLENEEINEQNGKLTKSKLTDKATNNKKAIEKQKQAIAYDTESHESESDEKKSSDDEDDYYSAKERQRGKD